MRRIPSHRHHPTSSVHLSNIIWFHPSLDKPFTSAQEMFTKAVVFLAFLALAAAQTKKPTEPTSTPVPILKQISKVNDDGSYTFGYEAGDGTFKVETRDQKGNVRGKYGYLDDLGDLKVVEYTAGNGTGFSATGDHLPEPVPEVPAPRPVAPQPIAPVVTRQQVQPQPQQFQPQPQQFQPQPQNTFVSQQFPQPIQQQQFQQPQNTFVPQPFPQQQQQQQFFPQPAPQQSNFNNFVPQNVPVSNFNSFPAAPQQVPQNFNSNFNANTGVATRNRGFSFSFDAPVVSAPPLQQQFPFQQQQFNNFPNQFNQQF